MFGTYGQLGLQRMHGVVLCVNTVALLMRHAGLPGLPPGRSRAVPETVIDLVKR